MGMVYLERVKTRLTFAVLLKDELYPDKKAIGDLFLKAPGIRKPIIRNSTGYYLFMDLPQGKYTLTAGGKFYKQEDFLVDTESVNPKQPCVDLFLKPKANYPFPEGTTILKGRIVDMENKPVHNASIKIKAMDTGTTSEADGNFFMIFKDINEDKNIVLDIEVDSYKSCTVKVFLKKGSISLAEINLIEKQKRGGLKKDKININ